MEILRRAVGAERADATAGRVLVKLCLAAVVICWLAVGPIEAALTTVLDDPPAEEPGLADPCGILDTLYGLDNLEPVINSGGPMTDQYWKVRRGRCSELSLICATLKAKYSSHAITFGFMRRMEGGPFQPLFRTGPDVFQMFDSPGPGMDVPRGHAVLRRGSIVRFGIRVLADPILQWSSAEPDNVGDFPLDEQDHMLTWKITGKAGFPDNKIGNYVVAWEGGSNESPLNTFDGDYNELVVELCGVKPVYIPEPASIGLLGLGVGIIAKAKRRKKVH